MRKLLALVVLLSFAGVSRANLVLNPEFHAGLGNWIIHTNPNAGGGVGLTWHGGFGHNIVGSAQFFGIGPVFAGLSQNIPTTAGDYYDISFWIRNDGNFGGDGMQVMWDGLPILTETPVPGQQSGVWRNVVLTGQQATSNSTQLRIGFFDQFSSIFLDDVSVVQGVPEPATIGLLGVAGMMMLGRRSRRH